MAAHFGFSLYCLNLAEFNDRTLMAAVNQIPANSVLLFEDIDCMKSGQARVASNGRAAGEGASAAATTSPKTDPPQDTTKGAKESAATNTVTLSGLLNVLDGFFAPTGVLFMMTTNHIAALDAALLRPGRIDYRLYLGAASSAQKLELYRRFFPEASATDAREIVEACPAAQTMAEFQGLLLAMAEDPAVIPAHDTTPAASTRKQEEPGLAIRI
jgi:mitochondrial chaperone BCS1